MYPHEIFPLYVAGGEWWYERCGSTSLTEAYLFFFYEGKVIETW